MNALSKFELSSATPVNLADPDLSELYVGLARVVVPPLQLSDLQVKQSGTISGVFFTHPDADHMVFLDSSTLLTPNILRVPHHGAVHVKTRGYPHVALTVHTGATVHLPTDTYAVVDTGTTSLLFTAFLYKTHNNPALEALASYDAFERPDWDGHAAQPITKETLEYVRRIVRLLPDTFGAPDIAPSADGSIGLEWVPDAGPLTKLFMDIGPGKQWHAYWQRKNGDIGRLSGTEVQRHTRAIFRKLFLELSM